MARGPGDDGGGDAGAGEDGAVSSLGVGGGEGSGMIGGVGVRGPESKPSLSMAL